MRVLVTCDVRGDTRRYRSLHLIEQLRLLGVQAEFCQLSSPKLQSYFKQKWDVVIFQRAAIHPGLEEDIRRLQSNGTLILADYDDLVFDPAMFPYISSPDFVDPIRVALYQQNMRNIRRLLDLSQACLVSTDYLAQRAEAAGKKTWVHRNAFSLEMLAFSQTAYQERAGGGVSCVLGYASGTPTHNRDFEMIKPAIISIMRKYPQVELHLVGPLNPGQGWGDLEKRIRHRSLVPWRQLPAVLAGFDINLAPLIADNPFAQSKSEIKWMEAALVGTPTIATPTDSFQHAICHGENGFLAGNEQDWLDCLAKLIENEGDLRRRIGEAARAEVLRAYHPRARAEQILPMFAEIYRELGARNPGVEEFYSTALEGTTDPKAPVPSERDWVPAEYEGEPSNLELGLYALRSRGLLVLLLSVWVYVRRLLAKLIPFKQK